MVLLLGICLRTQLFNFLRLMFFCWDKNSLRKVNCTYRIQVPYLKFEVMESLLKKNDDLLNVTMKEIPYYQNFKILHILNEGRTVIKINDKCYIRPMREEIKRFKSEEYIYRMSVSCYFYVLLM